jgi:hypothetical protein
MSKTRKVWEVNAPEQIVVGGSRDVDEHSQEHGPDDIHLQAQTVSMFHAMEEKRLFFVNHVASMLKETRSD